MRGSFGKRHVPKVPSNHRSESRPINANWLDPDAYDALSPKERRDLWAKRQLQRKEAKRRSPAGERRSKQNGSPSWVGLAALRVVFAGTIAWQMKPASWFSKTVPTATGETSVSASFSFCHTGGGYNCVVDGDTIWLKGQNIRVADIDAPETHEYGCAEEKALGDRATERLQELVNSGPVAVRSIDRDEDSYGRKLRIVEVSGESVGDTLVGEGLARWYRGGRRPWC